MNRDLKTSLICGTVASISLLLSLFAYLNREKNWYDSSGGRPIGSYRGTPLDQLSPEVFAEVTKDMEYR